MVGEGRLKRRLSLLRLGLHRPGHVVEQLPERDHLVPVHVSLAAECIEYRCGEDRMARTASI